MTTHEWAPLVDVRNIPVEVLAAGDGAPDGLRASLRRLLGQLGKKEILSAFSSAVAP